jgi:hypothetical protein
MLFTRLFALALLVHEALWLCQDGDTYFSECFLPAFGLTLSRWWMRAAHLALIALAAALLIRPHLWPLYPVLLLLLAIVMASYSLRLSNHLVVAWFMALALCLDLPFRTPSSRGSEPTPFLFASIQLIMLLTYLIAFFHKLNPEYLSPDLSCGAGLARRHLADRGIRNPHLINAYSFLAIYGTLFLEAAVPVLLLLPAARPLGLCLAVLLHLPFGLICQVHFSTLMYAGLAAFLVPDSGPAVMAALHSLGGPALLLGLAVGLVLGGRFGVTSAFHYRRAGLLLQLFFGVYTIAVLAVCLALPHPGFAATRFAGTRLHSWRGAGEGAIVLALLGLAYLLNGLSPYLGLKTEFSLAMFSNLRPQPWRHFIVPAPWRPYPAANYIRVERIEGLPERGRHKGGWMADLVLTCLLKPEQWQYSAYFFHEGLKLVCRSAGPTPVIQVVYVERGERHEVTDYAREMAGRPPHYLRATLFPYRLPLDPSTPHCA